MAIRSVHELTNKRRWVWYKCKPLVAMIVLASVAWPIVIWLMN